MTTKEEKRNLIITELYQNKEVNAKLRGIYNRYHVPKELEEDIKNESFYYLLNYNVDELIAAYEDKPHRILALWLRICLNRCINVSSTNKKQHSLLPKFLLQSNLNLNNYQINLTENIEFDEYNKDNINEVIINSNEDLNFDIDRKIKLEKILFIVNNILSKELKEIFLKYCDNPKKLLMKQKKELFETIKKYIND